LIETYTTIISSKAVADGAVIWNIISSVCSRAPRYSFGVICSVPLLPWLQEHQGRETHIAANGQAVVSGAWSQIVQKVNRKRCNLADIDTLYRRV
jgi:hypothetical protein